MSLPVRGAWVEIAGGWRLWLAALLSLPVRGAWVEIHSFPPCYAGDGRSLPVRGAWVEILTRLMMARRHGPVAPRAGSVG